MDGQKGLHMDRLVNSLVHRLNVQMNEWVSRGMKKWINWDCDELRNGGK